MNNPISPSPLGQPKNPFNMKLVAMIVGAAVLVGAGVFAAMYPWGASKIENIVISPAATQTPSQSAISIVSVSVLSPSGGSIKSLVIGDTATIKWQSQGVEKVDIGYRREGGGAEFISIATAIPATVGSYSWAIPFSALPAEFTKDSLKFIVAQSPNQCGAGNCGVSDISDEFSIVRNDLVGSWQIYRNEKYGFEFKYPSSLILGTDGETVSGHQWWVVFENDSQKGHLRLDVTENTVVDINAKTVSYGPGGGRAVSVEQIAVGTKKGILFDASYEGDSITAVRVPIGNHQLQISFSSAAGDTFYSDRAAIDQILSTFKFTK